MERATYNFPNQSKTFSKCYQKDLDPISRGHDSYIYYMIKLYLYAIYHNQLYTMKSIQNLVEVHTKSCYQRVKVHEFTLQIHKLFSFVNYA
jgi:hypothetical protein